jgi:hypothetical protein
VRYLRHNLRLQLIFRFMKILQFIPLVLLAANVTAAPPASFDAPLSGGWETFSDPGNAYKIDYPNDWHVLHKGNAVVITSPGRPEDRGVFGITLRTHAPSVEESVDKEFADPNHSRDLQKAASRLAGLPATKVWGSKKNDPNIRVVEYYLQKGDAQYYILFQAPHLEMSKFGPVFQKMIGSFQFL